MNRALQLVKPPALAPGDKVGIVAPASPVEPKMLARGCDALRALGYVPVHDEGILSVDGYVAGSAERRARELEQMFARDDVRAIVCARGGYGSNYLLPRIDLDVIRRHPKIFAGYSDVTTLLTWFHDAAGLVTFHGPMVAKDFACAEGVDLSSWRAALTGAGEPPSTALSPIVPGRAQGRLYGGCLSMLTASLGTPYEIRTRGVILLIEDVGVRPYQLDRMLMHLRLAGKLADVRGIVFGVMRDCAPPSDAGQTLYDVIRRVVDGLGIPVAFGLNTGHVERANLTVPLGVQASLAVEASSAALTLLEPAVSVGSKPQSVDP